MKPEEIVAMIESDKTTSAKVEQTSNLYTDLGFDSLSFIQLLLRVEKKYAITFDLLEMEKCLEVKCLLEITNNKLEEIRNDSTFVNKSKKPR